MKVNKLFLGIMLAISGCTTTTLEMASVPSIEPWDSAPDTREYKQNESLDKYMEFSSAHLSLWLTNYETKYRGNAILGIEVNRWPDSQFNDDEIMLALGVKPIKRGVELIANNIVLIMKDDGVEQRFKPYRAMKFKDDEPFFCGVDQSLNGERGTRSVDIADNKESLRLGSEFVDNCYNLYFKFSKKVKDVDFALDFTGSLLPLDNHDIIYFHKKLIKWRSSN